MVILGEIHIYCSDTKHIQVLLPKSRLDIWRCYNTHCIRKATLTFLLRGARLMNLTSVYGKGTRVRDTSEIISLLETYSRMSSARDKMLKKITFEGLRPLSTSSQRSFSKRRTSTSPSSYNTWCMTLMCETYE